MITNPAGIFTGLASLCEELGTLSPMVSVLHEDKQKKENNDVITPGCFLIYDPDHTKKTGTFHFMACSKILDAYSRMGNDKYIMQYRLTNRTSGEFEMYDGSLKCLLVCETCCLEYFGDQEHAKNFNLKEFLEEHNYHTPIPEKILSCILMGVTEVLYHNKENNKPYTRDKYPRFWDEIITPLYRETADWHCRRCYKDFSNNHRSLITHHKNRYKPDISRDNLEVLCRSCHGKEHAND